MTRQQIEPATSIRGQMTVPGDKSVSHRALIIGAMADGPAQIKGMAPGADVQSTANCLKNLGLTLNGGGFELGDGLELELNAGNSGTTMRLLMGALAGSKGRFVLTGDDSLSARPMERAADPLRKMGARIQLTGSGTPPVVVEGGSLSGIHYSSSIASAQVKGAVLLAAIQSEGETEYEEPMASRDHTERLLQWLGVDVETQGLRVRVSPPDRIPGFEIQVPGDFSSAAYFVAAAAAMPGSKLTIEGIGLNPTRTVLIDVLRAMGAEIVTEVESADPEPTGRLYVEGRALRATALPEEVTAQLIDELPLIGVLATQAEGEILVSGAGELRAKESDRISTLVKGLRELGAIIEEHEDGFAVTGPAPLHGGTVESMGDHRMAMCFAVAGLIASDPVTIEGWDSVDISYPGFLEDVRKVVA